MAANFSPSGKVSPSSSVAYPSRVDLSMPKICAIFTSSTAHLVYIFDSNLDCAADDVDTVDLDCIGDVDTVDLDCIGQQFVPRHPNLAFDDLSHYHCFCGIGAKIYIFEGINQNMLGPPYYGEDEDYLFLIGVYRFDILAEHLTTQSATPPQFNKTHMDEVYEMQGRKCSPQAIQFEGDGSPSIFTPTENIERDNTGFRRTFSIMAFTLIHDHRFVVQPDFGGVEFCLDISCEEPKWELWEGTFSSCHGLHLGSRNGRLIFNSYGAYEAGKKSVDVFPFPLCSSLSSSIYGRDSLIAVLEHTPEYVVCIMQIAQDCRGRLYWTMNMIKLNDEEFESRNFEGRFATRIKSFKFVDRFISFPTTISAMFPL